MMLQYIIIDEQEQRIDQRVETHKQALLGAFPQMYDRLYGQDKEEESPYEEVVPSSMEDYKDALEVLAEAGLSMNDMEIEHVETPETWGSF